MQKDQYIAFECGEDIFFSVPISNILKVEIFDHTKISKMPLMPNFTIGVDIYNPNIGIIIDLPQLMLGHQQKDIFKNNIAFFKRKDYHIGFLYKSIQIISEDLYKHNNFMHNKINLDEIATRVLNIN